MQEVKFIEYLTKTNHSKKSIISRVNNLKIIENKFNLHIDSIIFDKEKVVSLLLKIKNIDTANQNLSNALRHYYTFMAEDKIERLFKRV